MKRALVLVLAVACGKSDAPRPGSAPPPEPTVAPALAPAQDCEAARDRYLLWQSERVRGALQGLSETERAPLQAEADKENAKAKDKFVAACTAMGAALDASCFELKRSLAPDRGRKKHCDDVVHELEARMFR